MAEPGKEMKSDTSERRRPRKRKRSERSEEDSSSPLLSAFKVFQQELDAKHDRHERLVKLSRDVTSQSKKIIFLLHRLSGTSDRDKIFSEADQKFSEVQELLRSIAIELRGDDSQDAGHRYRRAYRMGIQEYVEALGFKYYCKYGRLVTYDEVVKTTEFADGAVNEEVEKPPEKTPVVAESSIKLFIDPLDYVLGLADLTGECMRLCINSVGSGETEHLPQICDFVRGLYNAFLTLNKNSSTEITKKMDTMTENLRKIETTCYTVTVRGSERPKYMLLADGGPANGDTRGVAIF
jgi:predicted translin family RNA/ssDNA-binding protein